METETLATPENAQVTNISDVRRKMRLTGSVVKTTLAGAVIDIGLDTPGVVHISQLQKEPVNKVEDVVQVGQSVDVWVRRVDPNKGRIELTMIEPLALEWREISKDMVLKGKVTRLEKFGAFVDIGAERPGLIHISELTHDYIRNPRDVVKDGDEVEVKVLSLNRRKKQIKLSMKALENRPQKAARGGEKAKEKQKEVVPEESAAKEEAIPTAMEMALREAMERAQTHEGEQPARRKRKAPGKTEEMENILSRTLEQKQRSTAK